MDKRYETLLLQVQKPGRYIGNETHAVVKDWEKAHLRVALAFPDVYDIGMSHLGSRILYHILNERDYILCERVFAPWPDMESLLRHHRLPLVSLENNKPLRDFDIIGISLPHELNYTNALNILDLAGIPLRSAQRDGSYPLVIAGGPSAFNPEPMADFIDLFLVGEGEEAIIEIAECYFRHKGIGTHRRIDKRGLLKALARLPGVYVPSLYNAAYRGEAFLSLQPKEDSAVPLVKKRTVTDFEKTFYPTKQIVPYIPLVHDRITLEIMRGCPHRCRFCQATALYSPFRMRSRKTLMRLAKETQKMTGHDEISLLSLSTGDYPQLPELLQALAEEFRPEGVSISLPSLRIEEGVEKLPSIIRQIKKTGFTFAPEVGSERLRNFVNKHIEKEALLQSARNAYELGWKNIKLYFMIGFPQEGYDDLDGLLETAQSIYELSKEAKRGRKYITISISPFIPKPHTPLQWEAMESKAVLSDKIRYIKTHLRSKNIKLNVHNIDMSRLEGVFSRGDRRLGDVIEEGFLAGARFDNWNDLFSNDIWQRSFGVHMIDPERYLRKRDYSETLPWEHIESGLSKDTLRKESIKAQMSVKL